MPKRYISNQVHYALTTVQTDWKFRLNPGPCW